MALSPFSCSSSKLFASVFLLFASVFSSAQNYTGCGAIGEQVEIGKPTTVCLYLGAGVAWNQGIDYIRVSFTPKGDQYSRFHIPNSYKDLIVQSSGTIWEGNNITLASASLTGLSFLRMYYDASSEQIYPYLTAIIDVRDGNVSGITWDDACLFCNPSHCLQDTYDFNGVQQTKESSGQFTEGCYLTRDECTADQVSSSTGNSGSSAAANICDVTLYVVWTGTDAKGNAFQSSASRFSAFPPQEIQNRILQNLPQIPNPIDGLTNGGSNNTSN